MGPFLCCWCGHFYDEIDKADVSYDGAPLCLSCSEELHEAQD